MNNFSIIIPAYNEEEALPNLLDEIYNINFDKVFEVIVVNDFSSDNTLKQLERFTSYNLRVISHSRRSGQSMAIFTGINAAKYDYIVTIDGDGQNNPKDIMRMLNFLFKKNESKIVCGIRKNRRDNSIRIISSKLANFVRKHYLGDECDDTGCSLKIFNKKLFLKIPYFDGIHRFIPALFNGMGIKPLYIEVDHRPRLYGNSKYGISNRLFKGIADMYKVKKLIRNLKK